MLCRGVESMIHKEIFMGRFRNHQLIYKARSLFSQLIKQYCLPHYRLLRHWREQKTCAFGIAMASTSSENLLKEVDSMLIKSSANWNIMIGHHTIRSTALHGHTKELVEQLLPILEANDVDLYMNGHGHCLQHIRDDIKS
ncbi:hypothetical protein ABKV19_001573 [Rosa sericea]